MKNYKRPILTTFLYALGFLCLAGAILFGFTGAAFFGLDGKAFYGYGSFLIVILVTLNGVLCIGIGQVFDYLARTAHSTERLCSILETNILIRLKSIDDRLVPLGAVSAQLSKGFYYSTEGLQQGPISASDLRIMHKDGLVTDDTPVLREGDSEWHTYQDFLALTR